MKKCISRIIVCFLIGCLLLFTAACSNQTKEAPGTDGTAEKKTTAEAKTTEAASKSEEKVTITWGYWGSPEEVQENKQVAEAFQQKNPNITVEHMTAPWNDYFTKLQTQFAGGSAPDVMFLTFISTYAPMGVLQEMEPLFEKYKFDISKYPKGALGLFTIGGKLYGIPRDNDTKVLFYNKKLFDDANIPYPKRGWTTDEFVNTAKQLTKKNADGGLQYGLLFDPGNWYLWVNMNQGKYFDNDETPTKVAMDDKNTVDALQFMGDLINKHKVTPTYDQLNDGTIRQQMFMNNQAAMLVDNHAQIPNFMKDQNFKWDVAYLPVFSGKPEANVAGGAGYTIYSKTKNIDASWKLWEFLNTEGIKMYMKGGTMVPVNMDLLKSPEFTNKPYNAQVFVDETAAGVSFPSNPFWWNVYSKANPFLEQVWIGGSSAKDVITKALPELDKEIKK